MSTHLSYDITWIPVKQLTVVWRKSQRAFKPANAKRIADEFDPDKLDPIIVTKPNGAGFYHVIAGQHRKAAIEQLWGGNEMAPCRVIDEADPARAAELFLAQAEGSMPIRPTTAFMIAVEAKREVEVAINAIVQKMGYHISDATKSENDLSAVGALRKVYINYSPYTLQKTLEVTRQLWGGDPQGVNGKILTGLGLFLHEFSRYIESKRLKSAIIDKYQSPWKFLDAVRVEAEKTSEPMDVAMAELVRYQYNKGLGQDKRLKRKES